MPKLNYLRLPLQNEPHQHLESLTPTSLPINNTDRCKITVNMAKLTIPAHKRGNTILTKLDPAPIISILANCSLCFIEPISQSVPSLRAHLRTARQPPPQQVHVTKLTKSLSLNIASLPKVTKMLYICKARTAPINKPDTGDDQQRTLPQHDTSGKDKTLKTTFGWHENKTWSISAAAPIPFYSSITSLPNRQSHSCTNLVI